MARSKKKEVEAQLDSGAEGEEDVAPLGLPPLDEKPSKKKKKADNSKKEEKSASASVNLPPEISIEIEKIKAQIEAMNQMRAMFNERFSTISEQIGELRTMVVSQEGEFSELEVKSAKANEIMTQIEPERFLSEISKLDMRIEAIKGKIESNEAVNQMIMKELKEQRARMAMFKGIEDTIKLNKEVRDELMMIKKVESMVEVHSNKVESMFMQVQKRFGEFEKFKGMAEDLNEGFKTQMEEYNAIKVKVTDFVGKTDLDAVKDELSKQMADLGKKLGQMQGIARSINDLVTAKKFMEFKDKSLKVLQEHQKAFVGVKDIRERLEGLEGQFKESRVPDMDVLKGMFAEIKSMDDMKKELEDIRSVMAYGFNRVQQIQSRMFVEKETYETIRQIIKKYLDRGYTRTQVEDAFAMQGWPKDLIKKYV